MAQVELTGISKSFDSVRVLQDLHLSVAPGEFISLLGPSGCGKTTTLNIVAGFLAPDRGDVRLAGESVVGLPPHRRNLGMVFQRYTLFPHMNVFDNIAFGLTLRRVSRAEVVRRVRFALELIRLPEVAARFPGELSGGQQQRIALARALIVEPKVLLLDEPLSNLDAKLRRDMQVEIRGIHERLGTTTVHVTHDQEEALVLSDRIAVMHRGEIAQLGDPRSIYERPRTRFVAEFVGDFNFLTGRVLAQSSDSVRVATAAGFELVAAAAGTRKPPVGAVVTLGVREERVRLSADGGGGINSVPACVRGTTFHGSLQRYVLDAHGATVCARLPAESGRRFEPGTSVYATFPPEDVVLFEAADGDGASE